MKKMRENFEIIATVGYAAVFAVVSVVAVYSMSA